VAGWKKSITRDAGFSMLQPQPLFPVDAGDLCRPDLLLYPLLVHAVATSKITRATLTKKGLKPGMEFMFFKLFMNQKFGYNFTTLPLKSQIYFLLLIQNLNPGEC
jgi:hypothetical protein